MKCGNCAEEIRPAAPGDGIADQDREAYPWVNEAGNPYCGAALTHEPMAAFTWRDMFAKYARLIQEQEGYFLLHESDWTPEEWAAITALPDMGRPRMSGAGRPEDRNADQRFEPFPDGATLTELASFITELRGLGAPRDAHPRVRLSEDGEIIGMVCVTRRRPEVNEMIARNSR